jgi:cellulose biosynthesis protein BcsQ
MKVVAVCSRKGGVGKSLAVRSLAVAGLFDNSRTAIIDADPQGSILVWSERREAPAPTVQPIGRDLKSTIDELREGGADYVFIDTPPSTHPIISLAVGLADFVVIVTGPYPEDLAAIGTTVQTIKAANKPAAIVLNRTPSAKSSAIPLARGARGVPDPDMPDGDRAARSPSICRFNGQNGPRMGAERQRGGRDRSGVEFREGADE